MGLIKVSGNSAGPSITPSAASSESGDGLCRPGGNIPGGVNLWPRRI